MSHIEQFTQIIRDINQVFTPEWLRSALTLALFSTAVVVGVFAYLNRYTRKSYFSLWTIGWAFYGLWLGVLIGLEETPDVPLLVMARRASIGISALCMFWGSFELTGKGRKRSELLYGIGLVTLWSYIAAYQVRDPIWITVPVFVLLAAASIFTGTLYLQYRKTHQGASLLSYGFILWGLHLLVFPVQPHLPPPWLVMCYFTTAALALFIALGMIVFVLEEARVRHDNLLDEFRQGVATRRMLEQDVSVSEQKYRALFDAAGDAIFLVDLETMAVGEANDKAEYFLGARGDDKSPPSFLNLCPTLPYKTGSLLENKRIIEELIRPASEFYIVRHNGSQVLCEGHASLVQYNRRPSMQITIREITERKRLEQQLRQSEKMSSLGQLVAGVAHELNNPLAVIMGYAQILTKQGGADPKTQAEILKILRESERAAKIVRNLLTFARPHEPQMLPVEFNNLIEGIVETYWAELGSSGIGVRRNLAPTLPKTMADPHQMEQVLTNLITNAVQAMAKQTSPRILELTTELRGNAIRITVADTGPGVAPELVNRVFDPFFTTKEPGKGTGLGLSICHTIIEEHRGRIWLESELGKGTKVLIDIPVVATTETDETLRQAVALPAPTPSAVEHRILVVDDEPGIIEVLRAVLTENGYLVDTAGNGAEAIEKLKAASYDLMLSDLRMPDMDGEALYKKVREKNPKLAERIIFITGDTVSSVSRGFLESTGNRWLHKPFNIAEVETLVANFFREQPAPPA